QLMLEDFRAAGGQLINAVIEDITVSNGFELLTTIPNTKFRASKIVNAAGPFASSIAAMLGIELPVQNSLQQKIAFPDEHGAIPRNMPFSIDLDAQQIDWSEEERELVAADPKLARLAGAMPGAIHCRPDGGDQSTWVRLGWAFGETGEVPQLDPPSTDHFPEVVLRGAARLNPLLKQYYGRLPRNMHHYSGYYTTTEENWPLIGELSVEGAYYVGAMSGFGTMSACAAGELCAQQVLGTELPDYAQALSLERYKNEELMAEISTLSSRGIL
ncbi:MAG: glycine/D-amino acid oxidase-like deaminating enzyme, partial [Parasphingorhabdus sp.]